MSHFTVLVVTDNGTDAEITKALQPFHEYECTGVKDEFVVFVDEHDDLVDEWENKMTEVWEKEGERVSRYDNRFYREFTSAESEKVGQTFGGSGFTDGISYHSQDWGDGKGYRPKVHMTNEEIEAMGYVQKEVPVKDTGEYTSLKHYAEDYHGYTEERDGRIGRLTNPNAQWDWWVVGGRWSNHLLLNSGERADSARKEDIDFETLRAQYAIEYRDDWDRAASVIAGRELIPFAHFRDEVHGGKNHDKAREDYWAQPVLRDLKDAPWSDVWTEYTDYFMPRDKYIFEKTMMRLGTFAILKDGEWMQRADMGWWGITTDEDASWYERYDNVLSTIRPNQHLTVVDCHI